jgi:hypothetical protein
MLINTPGGKGAVQAVNERHVTVTVSAKGIKPKSYVVSASSQAEATAKATKRFIENHPGQSPRDLTVQLSRA